MGNPYLLDQLIDELSRQMQKDLQPVAVFVETIRVCSQLIEENPKWPNDPAHAQTVKATLQAALKSIEAHGEDLIERALGLEGGSD